MGGAPIDGAPSPATQAAGPVRGRRPPPSRTPAGHNAYKPPPEAKNHPAAESGPGEGKPPRPSRCHNRLIRLAGLPAGDAVRTLTGPRQARSG